VRLLGKPVHRLSHAAKKEGFGLQLAAMPIRCGDKFVDFWNGECCK